MSWHLLCTRARGNVLHALQEKKLAVTALSRKEGHGSLSSRALITAASTSLVAADVVAEDARLSRMSSRTDSRSQSGDSSVFRGSRLQPGRRSTSGGRRRRSERRVQSASATERPSDEGAGQGDQNSSRVQDEDLRIGAVPVRGQSASSHVSSPRLGGGVVKGRAMQTSQSALGHNDVGLRVGEAPGTHGRSGARGVLYIGGHKDTPIADDVFAKPNKPWRGDKYRRYSRQALMIDVEAARKQSRATLSDVPVRHGVVSQPPPAQLRQPYRMCPCVHHTGRCKDGSLVVLPDLWIPSGTAWCEPPTQSCSVLANAASQERGSQEASVAAKGDCTRGPQSASAGDGG